MGHEWELTWLYTIYSNSLWHETQYRNRHSTDAMSILIVVCILKVLCYLIIYRTFRTYHQRWLE